MLKHPRSHETPLDGPEYVEMWARDILAIVGKRDVQRLVSDYKDIAANKQLDKADRRIAAERAKALERLLQ